VVLRFDDDLQQNSGCGNCSYLNVVSTTQEQNGKMLRVKRCNLGSEVKDKFNKYILCVCVCVCVCKSIKLSPNVNLYKETSIS